MDNISIKELMNSFRDEKNAVFFSKISPFAENVTGVRVPVIRKIAKDIIKENYTFQFLDNFVVETHEEFLLKGIVIAGSKISLSDKFKYLEKYVCEIKDWSACDLTVSTFKFKKDELKQVYDFILKYKNSKKEYEVRFMTVMLLNYFILEEYLDNIIEIIESIKFETYYTQMGCAWLVSVMFVKFRDYTLNYLYKSKLDDFTYNKSLQKIIESNRVSKQDKELIKTLKRKKIKIKTGV